MIHGVLFDYGGVIADDGGDLPPVPRLVGMFGLDPVYDAPLVKQLWRSYLCGGITTTEFWSQISQLAGTTISDGQRTTWRQSISTTPYPEIAVAIKQLQSAGYQLGLLSNITAEARDDITAAGTYDLFDFTILSCDVGSAKPDSPIYDQAGDKFQNLSPSEIVFIDDYAINLPAAEALGMHTIQATGPTQVVADLRALGLPV